MPSAYVRHEAIIELNPGQSAVYRLPPMTRGVVHLEARHAGVASSITEALIRGLEGQTFHVLEEGSAQPAATEALAAALAAEHAGEFHVMTEGSGAGTATHRDQPLHDFDPATELDPGEGGGGFGGNTGPTLDLVMELLRGGTQVVASDPNNILHESVNEGDIWSLRITRKADGSIERRRYRFIGNYPSVLPLLERRVPLQFLINGFQENWNDHPYIKGARIANNRLTYYWDEQFALLYGHSTQAQGFDLLDTGWATLPEIEQVSLTLGAGHARDPYGSQELPYISIRVDCEYKDGTEVDIRLFPDIISLPRPLWFELRLYLQDAGQGAMGCTVKVHSPLLDYLDRDFSYPTLGGMETINLKDYIADKIERAVIGTGVSRAFDKYLRPWMVGRYDIQGLRFDTATNDIVIRYAGKAVQPQSVFDLELSLGTGDGGGGDPPPEYPRLFDTPAELPPTASTGFDGQPVRPLVSTPGALAKIKHIVVLMQENRSFDQVLGYLTRDKGHFEVEGLLPGDNDRDKVVYEDRIYRSRRTTTSAWPSFAIPNPCHDHRCVERQISDGMKGAVGDYAKRLRDEGLATPENIQRIMDYYTDAELPTYGALVREFAICDHWFCSHIGPTLPNRFCTLTGELNFDRDGLPETENADLGQYAPSERKTFFDALTARGVSWKLFEHGYSFLRLFRNYTFDLQNIRGYKDPAEGFRQTVANGLLPQVAFIEPDYIEAPDGNDDHAPADMMNGQKLIADIVSTLIDSSIWEETLFIVTYDEHGGFYDHLFPPEEIVTPNPDGTVSRRPIPDLAYGVGRLGPRVPAFVVSPFIPRGANGVNVCKTVFDHTSIMATIFRTFCSPHPPRMSPRADEAADLRELLTLDTPRPHSDFVALVQELRAIQGEPGASPANPPPKPPLRKPVSRPDRPNEHPELEDFHGFMAFAASVTGSTRRS